VTPGPFVIYPREGAEDPYYNTHEPGHVLQYLILELILGPGSYIEFIGIPSIISATLDPQEHRNMPWEKSANELWYQATGEHDQRNPTYSEPDK
jgi:hypothetical protein